MHYGSTNLVDRFYPPKDKGLPTIIIECVEKMADIVVILMELDIEQKNVEPEI